MCIMCVAIPFVLVTIAPRFIPAAEVNLFFLLETIIGPIWVWLDNQRTTKYRDYSRWYSDNYNSYCNSLIYQSLKNLHRSVTIKT